MKNQVAPFIVIEGIDGSGKATQAGLLKDRFKSEGFDVAEFDFPRYGEKSAAMIEMYLNGELGESRDNDPYVTSTYYAIDRFHARNDIQRAIDDGKVVLSNRYVASNMAHQGQKINNSDERMAFFHWNYQLEHEKLNIPRPDLNIVLLLDPNIAQGLVDKKHKRDYTDKKRDIHEADINHLKRAVKVYKQLVETFPKAYQAIDCSPGGQLLSREEVHEKIWEVIKKKLPTQVEVQNKEKTTGMGVYSNKDIRQAINDGHIVCRPYNKKHVSHASLDVTLGNFYYRTERSGDKAVYNPFNQEDVSRYFGEAQEAVSHGEWARKNGVALLSGVPEDHPVIPLKPGERILAHTHEFFGIKPPGAYEVKSRSSWGRNGIAVCFDAGWVDPGYINRLTLEIYNLNSHETVLLPVGERIAQAVFVHTGEVEGNYGLGRDDGMSGKYQSGTNLDELISTWHPSQMLPKSFMDTRFLPKAIDGLRLKEPAAKTEDSKATTATQPTQIGKVIEEKKSNSDKDNVPKKGNNPYVEKNPNGSFSITDAGHEYLADKVTNTDKDVYAFTSKINPQIAAAAMARLSRRADDMRVTVLDEFAEQDGKEEGLLRRVITAYGDDSVQQLTGVHYVVENASNLLTKKVEWGRLAAYLEQSTRYIYFDQKDERGNYKYYTPRNFDAKTAKLYEKTMDTIFDIYSKMVRELTTYVRKNADVPDSERDFAWKGATRAQACDAIRDCLPVATTSTVGIYASGQALENMIMNLQADRLIEANDTGDAVLEEARKIVPVFLERADRPDRGGATVAYRANTKKAMRKFTDDTLKQNQSGGADEDVNLVDYWPKNELDVVPHMLYEHSNMSLEGLEQEVATWGYKQKKEAFETYMGERLNRRHKPGRAMENPHYTWDIVCDYGIFRDLQRHRMVDDMDWQELTPRYGYDIPELVEEAGLSDQFEKCFDLSYKLHSALQAAGYDLESQYAVLLGHKMRWKVTFNAREAFHWIELRTSPQGHPGYRRLTKMMYDKLAEAHPLTAEGMRFVNQDEDEELTRLAAEKYTQYKLEQLDKKNK